MTLVLIRVDCRLIHGQIVEAWVPFTRAEHLVVANDEAAEDPLTRSIMEMAVPPSVGVSILPVVEAAEKFASGRWAAKRTMVLVADCKDAVTLYDAGPHFSSLNLGNLVCAAGKKRISCSVSLDLTDMYCIKKLENEGIQVEARPVPHEPSQNLADLLPPCPR